MKTTTAYAWTIFDHDKTGGLLQMQCTCPECGEDAWLFAFAKPDGMDIVIGDMDFEIDVTCDMCNKDITVLCDENTFETWNDFCINNGMEDLMRDEE